MKVIVLSFCALLACYGQQFSAEAKTEDGVSAVHLRDRQRDMEVIIVPAFGNRAVAFNIHGQNVLFFPYSRLADFSAHPNLNGIPFLAPWANRLDGSSYWVNGREYQLNPKLKNYSLDNHGLPIHGLLSSSNLWEVADTGSDKESAWVTSRLALWKHPELMEQWPFAEGYEMTYRLADGVLEVRTTVLNRSTEPVPVVIGFHPYYRIPGEPRSSWTLHLAARKSIAVSDNLIPTGDLLPLQFPNPLGLKDHNLDNGFTDLERDANGRAHFLIEAGGKSIELLFGPKYPVAIVWDPPERPGFTAEFVCIEPMTAPTDAINLAHEGKYSELPTVPADGRWTESFWVRPSGF